ncbi:hypothetical protein Palpr_2964 [Paludibacter propionicigenes WB4]|uniref:Uncharacterized protein n=1 Tax=Paludibacter propionicigenes (strain DSM 17365 / JCM 13257 / WB4) TaxID=694427 RepID=E4T0M9_PALPW|nr:hypothetical protein [Paludibacter propionicigenes]ADQ81093.1 hypothetical protein Palpr_2964 [Paludibacter propionicigenes WB4]
MKNKKYTIPIDVDEFFDFESTLIYLLNVYATDWNIPGEAIQEIIQKRDRFEYVFFHTLGGKHLLCTSFDSELYISWLEFQQKLSEFYEQYLLHNEAISDDYKMILSIHFPT